VDRTVETTTATFETCQADLLAASGTAVLFLLAVLVGTFSITVAIDARVARRRTVQTAVAGGC